MSKFKKTTLPIHSCVGAIANRGQGEQGCSPLMATDLGPARATHIKKMFNKQFFNLLGLVLTNIFEIVPSLLFKDLFHHTYMSPILHVKLNNTDSSLDLLC